MNILYYDNNVSFSDLHEICDALSERKINVIVLPRNTELLMNCDLDTLVATKEKIEEAINEKSKF